MAEYLKRDVARILKKPPRTIEFWTASGLVIPDIEPSQGKGKPRVFSGRNLLEFVMIDMLARMGVSLDIIKEILSVLRKGEWFAGLEIKYFGENFDAMDREKGREKRQSVKLLFRDFWTSEAWGHSKELVYVSEKEIFPKNPEKVYDLVEWYVLETEDGAPLVGSNALLPQTLINTSGFVQTVILLGTLKQTATEIVLT